MPFRFLLVAALPLLAEDLRPGSQLTVHEWGTFTSVAGDSGEEVSWASFSGPTDLPCFVHRLGLGANWVKLFPSLIRMETPVLYFYAPAALTLSVQVDFPRGVFTEWYPQASIENREDGRRIRWKDVEVLPEAELSFPTTKGTNHYYAARHTDAAPLRVGTEQEKLLFYRGVAGFGVPLHPRYEQNGRLHVRNDSDGGIPAFLFERRGDRIGYQRFRAQKGAIVLEPLPLTSDLPSLYTRLEETLVEFGLYRKEAAAMLETWKDSWFEEGARLIYIVPRTMVDEVLPIRITPEPRDLARVFVGRIELFSPATREALTNAFAAQDLPALVSFGRFLSPFAGILMGSELGTWPQSPRALTLQHAADALLQKSGAACVQ